MSLRNIVANLKPLFNVPLQEARQFMEWVKTYSWKTKFEPEIMSHPRTCMATAYDEQGPILFLPFESCIMFDALAPRPDINKRELSYALWQIGQEVEKAMIQTGNLDAFATLNDDDEADSMIKHGWTEIKGVRLLRKRLPASVLQKASEAA